MVAPLDWGLGHATRCIPIIDRLLAQHVRVILAGSGPSLMLLRQHYPTLPIVELPAYNIVYGKGKRLELAIASQLPHIKKVIQAEHTQLQQLITTYSLDGCISDNRYGLWSHQIPSVFICHQLNILPPAPFGFTRSILYRFHKKFIQNFSHCWIPDTEKNGMAGSLSHPNSLPPHAQYMGVLSRFESCQPIMPKGDIDLVAVLSGPEPQRSIFQTLLLKQIKSTNRKLIIVQGKPEASHKSKSLGDQVTLIPHLDTDQLAGLLTQATALISRPGYSSLMDYATLGIKKLILVPTPGQTEQMELGNRLHNRNIAVVYPQSTFNLKKALDSLVDFQGFETRPFNVRAEQIIREFAALCISRHTKNIGYSEKKFLQ